MDKKAKLTIFSITLLVGLAVGILLFHMFFVSSFAGGSGTPEDPYQISNWTALNSIKANLSASYILVNNLSSLDSDYIGIGDNFKPIVNFTGTFDGDGHIISDLIINVSVSSKFEFTKAYWINSTNLSNITFVDAGGEAVGNTYNLSSLLFRNESSGEVRNISGAVSGGWVEGSDMNSVVYYWNESSSLERKWGYLSERVCFYDPDLERDICTGGPDEFDPWRGYFVKGAKEGISLLYNDSGEVKETGVELVVGWNAFSMQTDLDISNGNRTISLSDGLNLIGYSSAKTLSLDDIIFKDTSGVSLNYTEALDEGKLGLISIAVDLDTPEDYTGLFSYLGIGGVIKNVGLNVDINGGPNTGGLVGRSYGNITNSYTIGNIFGYDAGGLVGYQGGGIITDSYSNTSVSGYWNIGGLVGEQVSGTISNSFSIGNVSGYSNLGGLIGKSSGTITNSFYDSQTSGQSDIGKGTPKTTSQMKSLSTFSSWNISEVWFNETNELYSWNIIDKVSYPFLSWESKPYDSQRTINLSDGRNFIGYSSPNELTLDDIIFKDTSGVSYTYTEAKSSGKLDSIRTAIDLDELGYLIDEESTFQFTKAYWINSTNLSNITFVDAGGEAVGNTYNLSSLLFRNESSGEVRNISGAVSDGWAVASSVDQLVRVYNPTGVGPLWKKIPTDSSLCLINPDEWVCEDSLNSWSGYFVNGAKEGISLLYNDSGEVKETGVELVVGWNAFSMQTDLTDFLTIEITITEPKEQYYSTNESLELNYTLNEIGTTKDSCWFKVINSSGSVIINNQPLPDCNNTTFDVPRADDYNLTLYVNDTDGNEYSKEVYFGVNLDFPSIVLNTPTSNQFFNYTNNIDLNFTATYEGGIEYCWLYLNSPSWHINETFDSITSGVKVSTKKNLTDNTYLFNVKCNNSIGNEAFALFNRTFTIDTTLPQVNFLTTNQSTTTGLAVQIRYNITDTNRDTCYFTLRDENGTLHNYAEDTPLSCSATSRYISTTSYGTYSFELEAVDKAGNRKSNLIIFTNTAESGGSSGGGSTQTSEPKIPTIALSIIGDYSDLEKAIIYSVINRICSTKVDNEPLAVTDYSSQCALNTQEILSIKTSLLDEYNIEITTSEAQEFYNLYKAKKFFQFYATESEVDDFDLFTSILGITNPLILNPGSIRTTVVINQAEGTNLLEYKIVSNKPIKSCEVLSSNDKVLNCSVDGSIISVSYLIEDTQFFNKQFSGLINVRTDAEEDKIESKRVPINLDVYNIGYIFGGVPIIFLTIVFILLVILLFYIFYKSLPRRRQINVQKSLLGEPIKRR